MATESLETNNREEIPDEKIFDMALEAGSMAVGRVDRSTINNILSVYLGESDSKRGVLLVSMYILRQSGRGEIPRYISRKMVEHINTIFSNYKDEKTLRKKMVEFLTFMKWAYEIGISNVSSYNDLIKKVVK